eukprot:c22031_g1_i1.p1 GENE.c22031_g1_i1~~c22031_g1_i1.p1  ORF type:complete len:643 (+),score=137.52 c22031_g1_i1:267-1931(+)
MLDPPEGIIRDSVDAMKRNGMTVFYGRWLIEGSPQVLLLDMGSCYHMLGQWKGDLYETSQISIPDSDTEVHESVVFGGMLACLLGELAHRAGDKTMCCVQFHEWQVGTAIPLVRHRNINVATLFTTHATLLGRFLCAGETDFYNNLPYFDADREAGNRGIYHRFSIERSACHAAHVFSTVSDITADEAQHLLKRKAEVVIPNGLSVVDEMHEFQNLHVRAKEKINKFVLGHFYGHYDFDIDKTLYFFSAGRYEFLNKGADMFLESLANLNHKLKQAHSNVTVVAFLIFPTKHSDYNSETLKGQGVAQQLREAVEGVKKKVSSRIFAAALAGQLPDRSSLLTDKDLVPLKRSIFAAQRTNLPPIVTHNLVDTADPIVTTLRRVSLFNDRSDRVKVIFHPQFLNKNNPVFPIDYGEFVRGCHLGVFPSYYEPWGYTPAECAVRGIPSVTTNLCGFGRYMEAIGTEVNAHFEKQGVATGIHVVDRRFKSLNESIEQLASVMFDFTKMSRRDRIKQRNIMTECVAPYLDWKDLSKFYTQARRLALHRTFPEKVTEEDQ